MYYFLSCLKIIVCYIIWCNKLSWWLLNNVKGSSLDTNETVVCPASQERIRAIKDNLQSCKNLLHCKRDELRKLWIEGIQHKTIVAMLDQMYVSHYKYILTLISITGVHADPEVYFCDIFWSVRFLVLRSNWLKKIITLHALSTISSQLSETIEDLVF